MKFFIVENNTFTEITDPYNAKNIKNVLIQGKGVTNMYQKYWHFFQELESIAFYNTSIRDFYIDTQQRLLEKENFKYFIITDNEAIDKYETFFQINTLNPSFQEKIIFLKNNSLFAPQIFKNSHKRYYESDIFKEYKKEDEDSMILFTKNNFYNA